MLVSFLRRLQTTALIVLQEPDAEARARYQGQIPEVLQKKPQKKPPKDREISPEQLHHSELPEEHPSTSHVSLQDISHVSPSVLQSHNIILPELHVTAEANQSETSDHPCPNSSTTEKISPTSNASEGTADILNTRQDQSFSANETLSKESIKDQLLQIYNAPRMPSVGKLAGYLAEAASTNHATSHAEIAVGVNDRLSASETGANDSRIENESVMTVGNSSNFTETAALARESNRGCKWSEQTIEESLQLYLACGTKGYDLLCSKSLPLPSARSLRERIQGQQRPKDSKLHHSESSSFHDS
ncbi:hypothetical protein MTO96_033058 [Rhipicephalus appendiculatus]